MSTTSLLLSLMAPAGDGGGAGAILIFQVVAIGLVFYVLIIRPQGQARKQHEQMLSGLKKGDEVMTSGGIIGKVTDIKESKEPAEVRVTLQSGTSTLVVERSRIVRVGNQVAPAAAQSGQG